MTIDELPPRLLGYLDALCSMSNAQFSNGGMTYEILQNPPTPIGTRSASDDEIGAFFSQALFFAPPIWASARFVADFRKLLQEELFTKKLHFLVERDKHLGWHTLTVHWTRADETTALSLEWTFD